MQLRHDARVVVEIVGRPGRQSAHLGDRHADVEHLALDELLGVTPDQRCYPPQHLCALHRLQTRPRALVERPAGRGHCEIDVVRVSVRNRAR